MDGSLSLLVTDEHRRRAVELVTAAYSDGRLNNYEWQARIAVAEASRTREELMGATDGLGVSYRHLFDSGFLYEEMYQKWLSDAKDVVDRSVTRTRPVVVWSWVVPASVSFVMMVVVVQQSSVLGPYSASGLLRISVVLWVVLLVGSLIMYFRELYRQHGLVSGLAEALTVAVQRAEGK